CSCLRLEPDRDSLRLPTLTESTKAAKKNGKRSVRDRVRKSGRKSGTDPNFRWLCVAGNWGLSLIFRCQRFLIQVVERPADDTSGPESCLRRTYGHHPHPSRRRGAPRAS